MRILIWSEGFWPRVGGVEIYLKQFIPVIRKFGHDIAVITPRLENYKEEEIVEGVPVYRLPFYEVLFGKNPEEFFALRRKIEKIRNDFKPDLIHVILFGPSVVFHLETNKREPVPTLVAIHSDLVTKTDGLGNITHRALDQADHVVSVSQATLNDIESMFPQIHGKSSFIHNGLVTEGFESAPLPADSQNMLCIGRVVRDKGFDVALEALALVRKQFPGARLTIAGDGTEIPALEQQAQTLGIPDAVTFAGWRSPEQVRELISQSAMVLVPSRWREPFGLVAIEGALMARPVIASRMGGLAEVVLHGETGFLVEKENPAELASRIEEILGQPDLAARMGARGRADAVERFSIETNAAAYDALYEQVLANSRSQGG